MGNSSRQVPLAEYDHTTLPKDAYLKLRDALGDFRDHRDQHPENDNHLTIGQLLDIVTECILTTHEIDGCQNCDADGDNYPNVLRRISDTRSELLYQCRDCGHQWSAEGFGFPPGRDRDEVF